jgi:short-subunit dehydrogenase
LDGSSVFVSCVHPGGIRTPIARRARLGTHTPPGSRDEAVARFDRLTPTMPDAAATRILQGVERREPRILVGRDAWQIDLVQRLRPATYWKAMERRMLEPSR